MQISLESARIFTVHTLYRVTLPTLAVGGLSLCAALYIYAQIERRPQITLSGLAFRVCFTLASAFLLLVCISAPIAYAELSYPEARVLLMARLVAVLTAGALGWWVGKALVAWSFRWIFPVAGSPAAALYAFSMLFVLPGSRIEPAYPDLRAYLYDHPLNVIVVILTGLVVGAGLAWFSLQRKSTLAAAALLASAFLLQPVFSGSVAINQFPDAQLRGRMWDYRDNQVRQLAAQGQRQVQVQALDSWHGITELQANPTHWVNNCAAEYYGVDSITAVEPILNPPVQPVR